MRRKSFPLTEKQISSRAQGAMEKKQDALVRIGIEINKQVPAGDEIKAAERRISQQILGGEHHLLAQAPFDAESAIGCIEKSCSTFRWQQPAGPARKNTTAGARDDLRRDISGEDLILDLLFRLGHLLIQQHGEGVCLLAGGARWCPRSNRLLAWALFDHWRQHVLAEDLPSFWIAEKFRDMDWNSPNQRFQLGWVVS